MLILRRSPGAALALALLTACARMEPPARPWAGEVVVGWYCNSCHLTGAYGAPRTGDTDAWGERLSERGMDALLARTRAGIPPNMPANGLCEDCTDAELEAAIRTMAAVPRPVARAAP